MRWIPFFLVLAACASRQLMTMQSFADVPIGASKSEVVNSAGQPDLIRQGEGGAMEYEYVERISAGGRNITTRTYIFVIKDDKVTAKKIKQTSPPPDAEDSFDMQTTQKQ